MIYKHGKITMPRMDLFQSNAFRLKNGAIYESIELAYISEDGLVEKKLLTMSMIQNQELYIFQIMRKKMYLLIEEFLLDTK
mgnify:CR=1 FL=1